MPHYQYKGRDRRGEVMHGILDGVSAEAVAAQLLNSGITPVDIREAVRQTRFEDLWRALQRRSPGAEDLILLCRQMYTLTKAGVPINQAIAGLVRSTRNEVMAEILTDVKSFIESGREFSMALARHSKVFSSLFINTVRIGESTGRLDEAFLKLAEYLDRDRDTRARIKSALRYPTFVVVAIAIAIGIMNVVVIPQFSAIFARAKVELPLPTKILVSSSKFCVTYWPIMLLGLVVAAVATRAWVQSESGRYRWDKWKLSIPIIGDIVYRATLGRFARGFAMSLSAGVPLTQALGVMSQAVDNEYIGERVRNIRTGIERGDSLSRSATATGMFSPLVLQMLAVGEETGAVDELMAECAGFYEREVDYDVKNLSQSIEPVLILFLAGFVLLFALGVFLPMWDLAAVKLAK